MSEGLERTSRQVPELMFGALFRSYDREELCFDYVRGGANLSEEALLLIRSLHEAQVRSNVFICMDHFFQDFGCSLHVHGGVLYFVSSLIKSTGIESKPWRGIHGREIERLSRRRLHACSSIPLDFSCNISY